MGHRTLKDGSCSFHLRSNQPASQKARKVPGGNSKMGSHAVVLIEGYWTDERNKAFGTMETKGKTHPLSWMIQVPYAVSREMISKVRRFLLGKTSQALGKLPGKTGYLRQRDGLYQCELFNLLCVCCIFLMSNLWCWPLKGFTLSRSTACFASWFSPTQQGGDTMKI